jgi:hypothetical protein
VAGAPDANTPTDPDAVPVAFSSQQSTCQASGAVAPSANTIARMRLRDSKRVTRTRKRSHAPDCAETPVDVDASQASEPPPRTESANGPEPLRASR